MEDMSNFIVYVDESGDHGLDSIDPNYPVFVLAFCIFNKQDYITKIIPSLQQLKFKYFGHDMVIFHEYDIRKAHKEFSILLNAKTRADFIKDLSRVVEEAPFTLIATVIKKEALNDKYTRPENPYHMAMGFGIRRQLLWPVDDNYFGRLPLSWPLVYLTRKGALDGGHQATGQSIHVTARKWQNPGCRSSQGRDF